MSANPCKYLIDLAVFPLSLAFFSCASFPWMLVICIKHKKKKSVPKTRQPDYTDSPRGKLPDWPVKRPYRHDVFHKGPGDVGAVAHLAGYSSQKTNSRGSAPAVCRCQQPRHREQRGSRQGQFCSLMPRLKCLALLRFST